MFKWILSDNIWEVQVHYFKVENTIFISQDQNFLCDWVVGKSCFIPKILIPYFKK